MGCGATQGGAGKHTNGRMGCVLACDGMGVKWGGRQWKHHPGTPGTQSGPEQVTHFARSTVRMRPCINSRDRRCTAVANTETTSDDSEDSGKRGSTSVQHEKGAGVLCCVCAVRA